MLRTCATWTGECQESETESDLSGNFWDDGNIHREANYPRVRGMKRARERREIVTVSGYQREPKTSLAPSARVEPCSFTDKQIPRGRGAETRVRRRRDRGRVIRRAETGNVLRNLQQSLDETIGHPRRNTGYAGSNNSSACCLLSPTLFLFLSPPRTLSLRLSVLLYFFFLSLSPSHSFSLSLSLSLAHRVFS